MYFVATPAITDTKNVTTAFFTAYAPPFVFGIGENNIAIIAQGSFLIFFKNFF